MGKSQQSVLREMSLFGLKPSQSMVDNNPRAGGLIRGDVPPAFPSVQASERQVKAAGSIPLQEWILHALGSWPTFFCMSSFLFFSYISWSFASPFEWASLLLISYTIFILFCSNQSPLSTREENLQEILQKIDRIQEQEARQRLTELLAFIRNIRVILIAGHSLAVKDHFVRSSDPYCIIRVGETSHTSSIRKRTTNPRWNEEFVFESMNWQREVIHFRLWDMDLVHPDPMGVAFLRLNATMEFPYRCKLDIKRDLEFPADHVKGTIEVEIHIEQPTG